MINTHAKEDLDAEFEELWTKTIKFMKEDKFNNSLYPEGCKCPNTMKKVCKEWFVSGVRKRDEQYKYAFEKVYSSVERKRETNLAPMWNNLGRLIDQGKFHIDLFGGGLLNFFNDIRAEVGKDD